MNRRILLATALLPMAAWAQGGALQHGSLTLEAPWTRAAGQGGQGAGFLTIRNAGGADRLLSASTPAAGRTELHTMLRDGDIMRMRQVEAIAVPANGAVSLAPGGLHIMLIGLTRPLVVGESLPLTLVFEQAGAVTLQLAVQAAGARMPMH
jgi:copper(I)-binding protein